MNVQGGFLLSSFGLGLAFDEAINVTVSEGRGRILLSTFGPRQNQSPVEVDDLVVQPLAGPEASDVPVCNLLSAAFGYHTTLCENCIDTGLVFGR